MTDYDDDQEIPEHVRDAVVEAIKANDLDRLDALPAADRELAGKYVTRLIAYMREETP